MVNLTFRTSLTPPVPTQSTVQLDGLLNSEIDGNFKSLSNAIDSAVSRISTAEQDINQLEVDVGSINSSLTTISGTLTNKMTLSGGNETAAGTKTFTDAVVLGTQATTTSHAVRADRTLTAGSGLSGGGNFTADVALSLTVIASGSSSVGALSYNGTVRESGKLYGGTTDPSATTRLNYDGVLFPTRIQTNSIGVGTAAPSTVGEVRATGDLVTSFSDDRLKIRLGGIEDALAKVRSLSGFYYQPNKLAESLGYAQKVAVGVSAQDVQRVLPEVVNPAPIDPQYLTVDYSRLVPLLIEAIKQLEQQIIELKSNK